MPEGSTHLPPTPAKTREKNYASLKLNSTARPGILAFGAQVSTRGGGGGWERFSSGQLSGNPPQ